MKELRCAVGSVKRHCIVFLVGLGAEKNGGLISLCIRDGFVVAVDLEWRVSLYPHASVRIIGGRFEHCSCAHFIAQYTFPFGIVLTFRYPLNVALVRCHVHILFADVTFSPSALVSRGSTVTATTYFVVQFVHVMTVGAFLEGVADGFEAERPTLQVVVVALGSEKFAVT